MSDALKKITNMKRPSTLEELNALPEYNGPDAENVYAQSLMMKTFKDTTGNGWWLIQRPDGSYCKAQVDE